jgi:small conductance mechanosensitive channel
MLRLQSLSAALLALLLAAVIVSSPSLAQDPAAEEGPSVPAEVLNPEIGVQELTLRLVPLTVEELAAAAAEWRSVVKDATQAVVDAQITALQAEGEAAAVARQQAADLAATRDQLFTAYRTVVDSWEKKGGDAAAIAEYRAYRNSIIVEETRAADFETLALQAWQWMISEEGGLGVLVQAAIIIAALIGLIIVARIVRRIMRRIFGRVPNLSKLLQAFLAMVVYWLVLAFGLMIVLSAVGVDITPVFALIGGASFILAFAFQDTLGNLAAGLMIMINRPFDEGDYVDIGGTAGTVKAVNIVATTVTTPDNQVIVIPNSKVWGNIITNVTTSEVRRVDLTFGIGYSDSIEKAQGVLERLIAEHPLTLSDPAPTIRVGALGASSVDFIVRPWTKSGDYWTVYWDLTRQVKEAFDAEGISIPFPQTDVHLYYETARPVAHESVSAPESQSAGTTVVARNEE